MSRVVRCACRYQPPEHVEEFSRAWFTGHRDHHLTVFPECDATTRRNLQLFVEWS